MTETPKSHLPLRIEEITADWLSTVLAENYPGTKVTEVHVGTVIAGTATKVRLLLAYNEAGHAHRLPPTMWLKGGFIRHAYTFDERSEEHTSELQSLMRISYAVFCLKKKITSISLKLPHTIHLS